MIDDKRKKVVPVKVETPQLARSAEDVRKAIQRDVARLSRMAKETELMGEDALRRSRQVSDELRMIGYRITVLEPVASTERAYNAVKEGFERDLNCDSFSLMLNTEKAFSGLANEDRLFLQSFWLFKESLPQAEAMEFEAIDKHFKELSHRVKEKKLSFVITSLDETGKPCGAALFAYLPKSNALLVEKMAVQESRRSLGVDCVLVSKAIDVANLKALEEGHAGISVIVAEAEMPSPMTDYKENQRRIEKMQSLVNNGIYPVSDFDYSKTREVPAEMISMESPVLPTKIPVLPVFSPEYEFEQPVQPVQAVSTPEAAARQPSAILLCVRPVNASKEITSKKLKQVVKEVHERQGARTLFKSLFSQLKGKAVVKIILVDTLKLMNLGKLLGIAMPPPEDDSGDEGSGPEGKEKRKGE